MRPQSAAALRPPTSREALGHPGTRGGSRATRASARPMPRGPRPRSPAAARAALLARPGPRTAAPARLVRLRASHDRPFHLTGREKRIRKGRLADPRIACEHDDPRRAAPRLEPGVVERAEFALAADQGLGLEAPFPRLGGRLLAMAPRRRTPPLT